MKNIALFVFLFIIPHLAWGQPSMQKQIDAVYAAQQRNEEALKKQQQKEEERQARDEAYQEKLRDLTLQSRALDVEAKKITVLRMGATVNDTDQNPNPSNLQTIKTNSPSNEGISPPAVSSPVKKEMTETPAPLTPITAMKMPPLKQGLSTTKKTEPTP
ncbi:MAG: hypothetical protein IJ934_02290 [Acetobacter sp.]|nr:hypothetical protein [Acetobacter sp.]